MEIDLRHEYVKILIFVIMKKQLLYIGAYIAILFLLGSCVEEEHVNATADRAGISSLTAYFTSGTYIDKAVVSWQPQNSNDITDYVIPVPWYYPEESDNTTEEAMSKMKIVATLENNCKLDPPITVLDLNKKNEFTYTNPYGETKKITISGQRVKSAKCSIKSIMLHPGDLQGIIDEDNKIISVVTAADLSEMTADVILDPHATINPNPAEAHDMNNGFLFTITADNGTDKAVYKVIKQIPPKIANGYRAGSETKLFENDMTMLGVTTPNNTHPTLASIGSFVILNLGDGSVPQYFRKVTGTKLGNINLGEANADGAITSDCAGNMLICNYAASGSTLKIYKTNDVKKAPDLFISYPNNLGVNIGARLHVQGDLAHDAIITATPDACQNAIRWIVKDGKAGPAENILFGSVTAWGGLDGISKVCAASITLEEGCVFSYYDSGNCPAYYAPAWGATKQILSANDSGSAWGYNTGSSDIRPFNNNRYYAIYEMGYWPNWGLPGKIYVYDAGDLSSISGSVNKSSSLKYTIPTGDLFGSVGYASDNRFADVLMTPSEDGYFLYVFYTSNTHLSFGGYQFDCIDK